MGDNLLQIKNDDGDVVYMQGLLPDGTYGIVADKAKPFTREELTSPTKFAEHRNDLARRVDENISQVLSRAVNMDTSI